jgi:hypothetical protein
MHFWVEIMPDSAKSHQAITIIAAGTAVIPMTVIYTHFGFVPALLFEAGVLVTLITEYTPDLDVAHRHFGWLGNFIGLRAYAEFVPHRFGLRKRHWSRLRVWNLFMFSHLPLFGTLPRAFLLFLPITLLFLLFDWDLEWLIYAFIPVWMGMSYSDLWHSGADLVTGKLRETNRSFWRKRGSHGKYG